MDIVDTMEIDRWIDIKKYIYIYCFELGVDRPPPSTDQSVTFFRRLPYPGWAPQ